MSKPRSLLHKFTPYLLTIFACGAAATLVGVSGAAPSASGDPAQTVPAPTIPPPIPTPLPTIPGPSAPPNPPPMPRIN